MPFSAALICEIIENEFNIFYSMYFTAGEAKKDGRMARLRGSATNFARRRAALRSVVKGLLRIDVADFNLAS